MNTNGFSHCIALVELIGYIEAMKLAVALIFKLADLVQLYTNQLRELGVIVFSRIHSTDLKEHILANMPGLHAYKQSRDI